MTSVLLRGGLGNQLFQAAAALWAGGGQANLLVIPSQLANNQLDSFNLPPSIKRVSFYPSRLTEKLLNASLAISGEHEGLLVDFRRKTYSQILKYLISEFQTINIMSDLGKCSWTPSKKSELAIGYFQTYQYVETPRVLRQLMEIRPKQSSKNYEKFLSRARMREILVVHVRRGDYKKEPLFGLLSRNYYANAIGMAMQNRNYDEIWLFSDEPKLARSLVPNRFNERIVVPEEVVRETSEIFDLMRLGTGFVIANSSFSWWAATLSKGEKPQIYAPAKWFAYRPSPEEIIPKAWHQIESDFEF